MDSVLQRSQIGLEALGNRGAAVAATKTVEGNCTWGPPNIGRSNVEEIAQGKGSYFGQYAHVTNTREAAGQWNDVATFDDLPMQLLMALRGDVAPVALAVPAGATPAYDWDFLQPGRVDNNRSGTFEFFDGRDWWQIPYALIQSWTLSGAPNQPVRFTATLIGRDRTLMGGGGTPGLPDRLSREIAIFESAQMWVNGPGTGIGTTPLAADVVEFELTGGNSYNPRRFGTSGKTYKSVSKGKRQMGMRLTLDYSDRLEYDRFIGGAAGKFRLLISGSAIGNSGYNRELLLDTYGPYSGLELPDRDGALVGVHTLMPEYDATAGTDVRVRVRNGSNVA